MQKQRNIPQLRFPEFKGEWEKKKLGDITFKTDKKNKQKEILPVYSISNKYGFIPQSEQFEGVDSIERGYDTSLYKIIENKTFSYNPARINVGSIGYNENLGRVIVSSLYVCFQTKENIDDNFLFHFFNTAKFNNSVLTNGEGGVRIYLFYENFSSIPFSLPSPSEQKKIASFITNIDKKISELKQKKKLLEQYKKGIMQKIFSQELRFKDDKGKGFSKWEKKNLSDLVKIMYGKDQKQIIDENGKYPILGTGGIMGKTNKFLYDKPSVLIGRKGNIDKPVYMDTPFWTVDTLFYTEVFSNTFPKWLFYKFQTINWYLYNEASGVPSLSGSTIYQIAIELPSIAEQTKISNFLSAIDEKINRTENQIQQTEQYKKGLLQNMFC